LLGFAIVDRQPNAGTTAVWLTSREGARVSHTNAVLIAHDDDRHDAKVRALTADRVVVLTDGTTPPLDFVQALNVREFDELIDETVAHQQRISQAIADYKTRTRNKNLVTPNFPAEPKLSAPKHDEPASRALSVADYVAGVWMAWLVSDEQRLRRTTDPRTGTTPWIMPEELGDPGLAAFPPEFAGRVKPEPLA
jgi:hypothetical protein